MTEPLPQVPLTAVAMIAVVVIVAFGLLVAARRYLLPERPVVAGAVATAIVGLAYLLSGIAGAPTAPFSLALAPAAAIVATAERPLSADAWLRGAAALAAVLTVLAVVSSGSLMTMLAGTATTGGLCFLLGRSSAARASS